MSHPQKNSANPGNSGQTKTSKTVFMASNNPLAVLVEISKRKKKKTNVQFGDAHAALAWCQLNEAGFVFFQGDRVEFN
jgi:hypothetical protein